MAVEAYNNLGLAYQDLGQLDQAEQALLQAVQREPENAAATINLQMLQLRRQGRERLEIYQELTRHHPSHPELWRGLATEFAAVGRIEEAIAACRQVLAIDPSDQRVLANLEKLLQIQRED